MTAATAVGICTKTPRKGPFRHFIVGPATIPNRPRRGVGPKPPKTTPQDGLTTPIARLTGVGNRGPMMARTGSARRPLDPAGALQRQKLSGAPAPKTAPAFLGAVA